MPINPKMLPDSNEPAEMPEMKEHGGRNIVYISPETFENDPQDGEILDFSGSGKLVTKPDGSKCLEITEIEGVAVEGEKEPAMDENLERIDELKGLMRSKINEGNDSGEGEA